MLIQGPEGSEDKKSPVREPEKTPRKEPVREPATEPFKNDPYGFDDPDYLDIKACSATDCTGLIPALPQTDSEMESYAQVYHYPGDIFHD